MFEYLRVTKTIRQLINDGANKDLICEAAKEEGMKSLRADALDKMIRGRTSLTEMMRIIS